MIRICQLSLYFLLTLSMFACSTMSHNQQHRLSPATLSELQYGKRLFEGGYYKRAMRELLPLACDGNADAQYAVGYMYYYGYGVAQDTDVGYFWIERAANQNFIPAVKALQLINQHKSAVKPHPKLASETAGWF